MSVARKRRRWQKWSRYVDYCCRFGERIAATRGMERAYNERAIDVRNRNFRNSVAAYVEQQRQS